MKKITFLLFALIAFTWQTNAQFTESFEGSIPATWTVINLGDTNTWVYNGAPTGGAQAGTGVASIIYSATAHDDYLITPAIPVTTGVNDRLSMYVKSRSASFLEPYEVLLSTTDAMAASFTVVLQASTEAPSAWTPLSFDLSAYVGGTVYVAIRATGTDEWQLFVDNVVNDAAPTCTPAVSNSETIMPDCGNSQFSVDVDIASVGDGAFITDGLGGMFPVVAGTVTAGPYAFGSTVTLTLEHSDSDCDYNLGTYTLAGCPPANDACAFAETIACGGQYTGDTTYANPESPDPGTCDTTAGTGGAVWYTFTGVNSNDPGAAVGTTGDDVALDLGLSTFDTKIRVFEGACGALVCVGGNDDTVGVTSFFEFTTTVGTDYYVLVHGYAANVGAYTLDVSCVAPPLCTATVVDSTTIMPDCANSEYSIDVEVSVAGDGTYISDGVNTYPIVVGTVTAGPYAVGTTVTLTVEHSDGDCDYSLGDFIYDCPPNCATNPFPGDGDMDIPVGNITFTWEAPTSGPAPTSYNLYAGITPTGDDFGLIGNFPGLTADITLSGYNTLFYWIIKPVNGSTEASGCDVWSFTTGDAPVGALCENAILVTSASLPYTTTDDTSFYGNDYTNTDVPPLAGAQYTNGTGSAYYITGDDVVYAFTPDQNGTYNFDLSNTLDDWIGFWLFEGCPFTSVVAYHTAISGTTRSLPAISLIGGTTYYVVISTWPAPQSTPYTLDITLDALSIGEVEMNDSFSYYPNPVNNTLTLKGAKTIQDVTIYNMLGQEVLRTAPNTFDSDMDMSNLKAGTYFVKVTVENATKTIKIIKK